MTTHDAEPKILDLPIGLDATGMRKEFDSLGSARRRMGCCHACCGLTA
jgi:hypothetical protein